MATAMRRWIAVVVAVVVALNGGNAQRTISNDPVPSFLPAPVATFSLQMVSDSYHRQLVFNIGTPPQALPMLVDLGSSNLLVFNSNSCFDSSSNCYDESASSSFSYCSCNSGCATRNISNPLSTCSKYSNFYLDADVLVDNKAYDAFDVVSVGGSSEWSQPIILSTNMVILRANLNSTVQFRRNGGVFGLGYSNAFNNLTLSNMLQAYSTAPTQHIFGLNFTSTGGTFDLGGVATGVIPASQWSEKGTNFNSASYDMHTFNLFNLRLCGGNLLDGVSAFWTATFDSGSACLTLPSPLFDRVLTWTNTTCTSYMDCYVPLASDGSVPVLPTLSFQLQSDGQAVSIPLSNLLLSNSTVDSRRICLQKSGSAGVSSALSTPIVFGSLVMTNIYVAFHMLNKQIGMASNTVASNQGCAAKPTCIGAQTYSASDNVCVDPPCTSYLFKEMDPSTGTCQMDPKFVAAAISLLVVFSLAELGSYIYSHHLGRSLYRQLHEN
eukprot:GILK01004864.1.p1 GENE.GILK01004864.1~~GILK01004864.1.p1  ORF type:complete len:509 (+),score=53.09 GILK01004864.1:47-1528(+)